MKKRTTTLLTLAGLAFSAVSANAATVTLTGDDDFDNSGTVVYALNFGGGTTNNGTSGTTNYDSITFTDVKTSGNHATGPTNQPAFVDIGSYAGLAANTITMVTNQNFIAPDSGSHFSSASLSGQSTVSDNIFYTAVYTSGTTAQLQDVTINGLDAGKNYMVQLFSGDNRSWSNWSYDVLVDGADSGAQLDWGVNKPSNKNIAVVTGLSGATSYSVGIGGADFPGISGIVVSEVIPEPSVALLGTLGVFGLLRRRRSN